MATFLLSLAKHVIRLISELLGTFTALKADSSLPCQLT